MRFVARKYSLLFACCLAILITWWVSSVVTHYPAQLVVNSGSSNGSSLTVYIDSGKGFREDQRAQASLSSSIGETTFDLPAAKVYQLRFDIDKKDFNPTAFIESLCLRVTFNKKETCWDVNDLASSFTPLNSIESSEVNVEEFVIKAEGSDPHFTFSIDFQGAQEAIAKIPFIVILLLAIFMLLVVNVFVLGLIPLLWGRTQKFHAQGYVNSIGAYSGLVCLASIMLSGAWLIIFKSGWLVCSIFLVLMLAILFIPTSKVTTSFRSLFHNAFHGFDRKESLTISSVSLLALLPLLFFVLNTWVQEFPHLGDHEYHMWGNKISYQALSNNYLVLFLSITFLLIGYFSGLLRWFILLVFVLIFSTGIWNFYEGQLAADIQGVFSRYPSGARTLAQPFVYLSYLLDWHSPLNTARIVNMLSIPLWLLVLRPMIIGRLPGLSILPFVALFFWQAEILYLFTTSYLDIWCAVFVLLALEKLLVDESNNAYLKSCLLLAVACAFKEPAVFIIPWFWLSGWTINHLKLGISSSLFIRFRDSVIVGLASVLPFLIYYVARKETGFSRYTVKGFEYFLTESWFNEMANRMLFHFGVLGVVALFIVLLLWIWMLVSPRWTNYRWKMFCILGAIMSQIFLFNWDQGGIAFTGYLRFYLLMIVLFFAPMILLFKDISNESSQKGWVYVSVLFLVLTNSPKLYSSAKQFSEPDSVRSFNEHYDAPIYLPIRNLIKQAENDKAFKDNGNKAIHINHVTSWNQPAFAYPDLLKKYKLNIRKEIKCECSQDYPTVLAPFVYMSGLNADLDQKSLNEIEAIPQHQVKYVARWREVNNMRDSCLASLKLTCQNFYQQTTSDGAVVGAIGVDVKQ